MLTVTSIGMCGAAAMYLKGEGGDQNTSRAIEMYEEVSIRASYFN